MRISFVVVMLLISQFIFTQSSLSEKKNVRIHKINEPPQLDGELTEIFWTNADAADDFWQYFPTDSILAQAPTEIKMVYDDEAFYLGIICRTIGNDYIIPSLKRDFRAGGNDNITLLFDPFNDGANSFFFGTNPYGVLREGLISSGGTTIEGFTTSWDNKWFCETKIYDGYWVAEIKIPFSTIRYSPGATQWRFNSYRFDMQTNERSTWMRIPRNQWIFSLGYMGDLMWEEPLQGGGSKVSVIPYISAGSSKDYEEGTEGLSNFDMGGDAKIAITSGLNLDLTLNPDFSQVEVDQQITDLSRFEIFFPERRQFFLENADLFGANGAENINPFFSRRIGVAIDTTTETSVQNTIYGGFRLSGKLNDDWRLGLMSMQAASDEEKGVPSTNFSVATIQRKVGARSFASMVVVNKQSLDAESYVDINSYNRVIGADYNLATADNRWTGKTFVHKSFTPQIKGDDWTHGLGLEYRVNAIQLNWNHEYVGENYNAESGFVRRTDYYAISPRVELFFYPRQGFLNQHGPFLEFEQIWQPGLGKTDQQISLGWSGEFKGNERLFFLLSREYTFLFDPFDPTGTESDELPAGTDYSYYNLRGNFSSDNSKVFSLRLSPYLGQYFSGNRFGLSGSFDMRFQPHVSVGVNYSLNRFDMEYLEEVKSTYLIGPSIDITFTKKVFLTTFLQYNSQSENTNINARFQWRFAPVSDLYLVWSENYFTGTDPSDRFALDIRNRSIVAKLTYWLNI